MNNRRDGEMVPLSNPGQLTILAGFTYRLYVVYIP